MIKSKIKIRTKYVPKALQIIFEDKDIIVIDKSAGLLSAKAKYEKQQTAHNLLTNYIKKGNAKARGKLFVVHRLDRETSGVMIFAKSFKVREKFARQWGNVEKKYLALVQGRLKAKSGVLESYLAEDKDYNVRTVSNAAEGQLARTKYKVIGGSKKYSLLEIELLTGKKNQIRVQFAQIGHPVAGDVKYGRNSKGRLALHAWLIKFNHPFNDQEMQFETKIPEYFLKYFPVKNKNQ